MMIWRRTKYSTRLLGLHACVHNNNNPSPEQQTGKLKSIQASAKMLRLKAKRTYQKGTSKKHANNSAFT